MTTVGCLKCGRDLDFALTKCPHCGVDTSPSTPSVRWGCIAKGVAGWLAAASCLTGLALCNGKSVASASDTVSVSEPNAAGPSPVARPPSQDLSRLQALVDQTAETTRNFVAAVANVGDDASKLDRLGTLFAGALKNLQEAEEVAQFGLSPEEAASLKAYDIEKLEPLKAKAESVLDAARVRIAASAGTWRYSASADEMTGDQIEYASTISENSVDLHWPYGPGVTATMWLRDHPRNGRDVFVKISAGQIQCHQWSPCSVLVRFDDGEATKWRATGPADDSTDTVFIRDHERFRKAITRGLAKTVRIELPLFEDGQRIFTFDTRRLKWL